MSLLKKFDSIDPHELVDFLIQRKTILPKDVKQRLQDNFASNSETPDGKEDFDLRQEVIDQMMAVRALRRSVVSANGRLEAGTRDTKEALSASTSLLSLLTKIQAEVWNMDRIRTIQKTTIDVLKDIDPALQNTFVTLLEERLKVFR
jgi:hypothetical protein